MSSSNKISQVSYVDQGPKDPIVSRKTTTTTTTNVALDGTSCEKSSTSWGIAMMFFVVVFLMFAVFSFIWIVLFTANPYWVQVVELGSEGPNEFSPPDSTKCATYAALIDIGIFIILGIVFKCTSCRNKSVEKLL